MVSIDLLDHGGIVLAAVNCFIQLHFAPAINVIHSVDIAGVANYVPEMR